MTAADEGLSRLRRALPIIGHSLVAVWIFGGALVYYVRFTLFFFGENQAAIDELLSSVSQWLQGGR